MNDERIVFAEFKFQLANGFHKRQRLDVAHAAAYFGDDDVVFARVAQQPDVALDFVGDVGHHLHGFAQEIAPAFAGDDVVVDAPGGDVVGPRGGRIQESLVVTQIKVGFGSVVGDVAFAVFVGVERTGVDVDVGIELLDRHRQAPCLQKFG